VTTMAKFILLSALLTLLAACGDKNADSAGPMLPDSQLDLMVVAESKVATELRFDGTLEALNQATVSAQTAGRVTDLPFDVGDYVEKGALVLRMTSKEQSARVAAAEGALAEANAVLAEADKNFKRAEEVYAKKLIAQADYDKSMSAYKSAQARRQAAAANLDQARQDLSYTEIRAPYSGILVQRLVQVGETVAPGTPLIKGLSLEHLRAIVDIPQQYIGPLRKHRLAHVQLPEGKILEVAELRIPPNADPDTHTFRVLATLPEGDYGVFPGTLVKVSFVSGERSAILLPDSAVVRRGELRAAYVVGKDNRIELRYLRLGRETSDKRVTVDAGLNEGERIATDPLAAASAYKAQEAREAKK